PDHAGPRRQPAADREVAVAGDEWSDQREQGVEVGREVDVHVGDHGGVTRQPGVGQGPAATLLVEVDGPDAGQLGFQPAGYRPGVVGACVVRDRDSGGEGQTRLDVGVEIAHAG